MLLFSCASGSLFFDFNHDHSPKICVWGQLFCWSRDHSTYRPIQSPQSQGVPKFDTFERRWASPSGYRNTSSLSRLVWSYLCRLPLLNWYAPVRFTSILVPKVTYFCTFWWYSMQLDSLRVYSFWLLFAFLFFNLSICSFFSIISLRIYFTFDPSSKERMLSEKWPSSGFLIFRSSLDFSASLSIFLARMGIASFLNYLIL